MDNKSKYLLIVEHDNGSNGEMHCVTYIHKDTPEEIQEKIKEIRKDKIIYKYAVYSLADAYTSETHDIGIFLEIARAVLECLHVNYEILSVQKDKEDPDWGFVKYKDFSRDIGKYGTISIKIYPRTNNAAIADVETNQPFIKAELMRNPEISEYACVDDIMDIVEKTISDYKAKYMSQQEF